MPDPYDDALLDYEGALKEPNHFQNILEKAANVIKNDFMPSQSSNPFMQGVQSTMQGLKTQPGLGPYMVGHDIKSDMAQNLAGNPVGGVAMDMISDPETLIGAKGLIKGTGSFINNVRNPSKVFGNSMTSLQESNPNSKLDFFKIINNALEDPMAKKAIDKSGILEKYGGTSLTPEGTLSNNLSNLSLEESQNLINDIKFGVKQSIKEGNIKSKEIGIAKMFSELSDAQNALFKGFDNAKRSYGVAKNVGKFASSAAKKVVGGSLIGAGGKLGYDIVKGASRQ